MMAANKRIRVRFPGLLIAAWFHEISQRSNV